MKLKILFLGLVAFFVTGSLGAQVGGTTGPLTWKVENDTLTISGHGEMRDYGTPPPDMATCPWYGPAYQFNTVIIEEGVQSIGEFAFLARSAYSIVIANSVEKYSPWAFAWSELISITNLNPIPVKISRDVFVTVDIAACTLKVPRNSVALYKRTDVWREFYILDLDGNEVEIDTELEDGSLLIYPNPSAGSCRVVIPEIFLGEPLLTLSIYDLSGVLLQQITVPKGNEEIIVDLELKAQGVYVVVMSNGEKSRKGKIMFE